MWQLFRCLLFLSISFAGLTKEATLLQDGDDIASKVTFVFTADMPNISDPITGRYANLHTLLDEVRGQYGPVFFIFGGGSIGPSAMSSFDRGSHIIDLLNTIEPDVMGVTKREFSFYENELSLRSFEAAFPIVASNVATKRQGNALEGLYKSIVVEKQGASVGIISVLHERVIEEYQLTDIAIDSPLQTIYQEAKSLRRNGAQFVLLHYSYPFAFVNNLLDQGVIDAAFISDSRLDAVLLESHARHENSMALTQQGSALVATFEKKVMWENTHTKEHDLSRFLPNETVISQVADYEARLQRLLNIKIGEWKSNTSTMRNQVRRSENGFANFIVDTLRTHTKADVALLNGGSIRGDKRYTAGEPITRQDIIVEMPFRAHAVTLGVSGEQLMIALEEGLAQYEHTKGGFPHVSGMSYTFDSTAKPFERVRDVFIGAKRLQKDKLYTIATSDFLANGGDGYYSLKNAEQRFPVNTRPPQIAELVMQAVGNQFTVKATTDGRIRDVSK